MAGSGEVMWRPSAADIEKARITDYRRFLARTRGLDFADYEALWRWSVDDLEAFWGSIWAYFDVRAETPPTRALGRREMPGARWFEGARLNFVDQILRHHRDEPDRPALLHGTEEGDIPPLTWGALREQVAGLADGLRALGIGPGDRVVALLPNVPETIVAFLATASIGAIWSVCSSDMGPAVVLDRFRQIEPKAIIAADGYRYGGKAFERGEMVAGVVAALPSIENVIIVPRLAAGIDRARFPEALDWRDLVARRAPLTTTPVAADHPLWIVYSSGTTGLPKPIVHGHAGIVAELLVLQGLHCDIGPDDVVQWYTSSGWIIWNAQLAALALGASVALYDGSPAHPDLGVLFRFMDRMGVTIFGSGAAYWQGCAKAGFDPSGVARLDKLRALSSTGSPLSDQAYDWIADKLPGRWLAPIAGGTDFSGAFIVGVPILPVHKGEMQCRALGHDVQAFDAEGRPVIEEVGELVLTKPVPSMPLRFWNDPGDKRYRESYFEMYPGIWRHGDWVTFTKRGGAIIHGRSDATVNRFGIRMGTAEFYRVVDEFPAIADAMVVDLEHLGRESFLYLFVVMRDGAPLDAGTEAALTARIREALSPRHVPNAIVAAPSVPYTLTGKKLEVPVKRLLLGHDPAKVAARDAMANPASLDWYEAFAKARAAAG